MDFYRIGKKETKAGIEIFPDFTIGRSKDLMVQGRSFYAIWDEEKGLWSRDEYDVQRLVDEDLVRHEEALAERSDVPIVPKWMGSWGSNSWAQFRRFVNHISDNSYPLDDVLTFENSEVKKSDYVSRRLSYSLEPGDYSAWDELVGTLYSVEERTKIEWAIGAVVSGDSKRIQKFLVFYGPAGTGKSTVLNIIQKLFEGYTTTFEAKALGSNNNSFATEAFRSNPLVAIQHDGDLSRIEDNTKLNSIIAHEDMLMNVKYQPSYTSRVNAMLFMGTNQPVKISDAKSGIIRRLIDVHPTGIKIPPKHYQTLMTKIDFELGAIAHHCLDIYRTLGKNHYNAYRPVEMMFQTDIFFNFIEANYDIFKAQGYTTLHQAYTLYKEFCFDTGIPKVLPQYKVREELRNYFDEFSDRTEIEGVVTRSVYSGFNAGKFKTQGKDEDTFSLVLDETVSIFDEEMQDQPAQSAKVEEETGNEIPSRRWITVNTRLADIDTTKTHFVKVPERHVVIDFDLRDESGRKSLERSLEAASAFPPTYAEVSRGGEGIHLHYNYDGDVDQLDSVYANNIEVKVYRGNSALRRKLSKCNNVPIATINSGLPIKEKKMLAADTIQSEKGLRDLIARNLRKEIHPGTKSSIDFIQKILEDAYASGLAYDVTDLRSSILAFANNSTNQSLKALQVVQKMKWKSEEPAEPASEAKDDRLVFFDVEVYPNLFVVCWKYQGDKNVVRMINPTPQDIEKLFVLKLVGFNCRRYDNHMLYARFMGYDNERLYNLSQKIIDNNRTAMFREAYNLSFADIYDFSSKKQPLKKFQIELGLPHKEMDLPWDQPVPEDRVNDVVEYCVSDVVTTEVTFESRKGDFTAREILAELSGLSVNHTTQNHTARIVFGKDRNPQAKFVYTDLSKEFDGYIFDRGVSTYRGETVGEGGYVYAEPGIYSQVAVLDVASMHPTTIEHLNLFGEYTRNFADLKEARMAIKRGDLRTAGTLLDGKLKPYLASDDGSEALAYALKIVINIVYGLTSAKFDNPFRDIRNIDNIVAKRGALFMIDLKNYCQELGLQVIHIKTDSIKIPNATPEITDTIIEFGAKYGYEFELETTYDKFCLVNDAVYIARDGKGWTAVGAQFAHPYVYKSLFSGEELGFDDYCETKHVTQGVMWLDFEAEETPIALADRRMHFVGRTGRFVPVMPGTGGGVLYRVKDDKLYAVTGTKGYFWMEAEIAKSLGKKLEIDESYFENLALDAQKAIEKFGSFEEFIKGD